MAGSRPDNDGASGTGDASAATAASAEAGSCNARNAAPGSESCIDTAWSSTADCCAGAAAGAASGPCSTAWAVAPAALLLHCCCWAGGRWLLLGWLIGWPELAVMATWAPRAGALLTSSAAVLVAPDCDAADALRPAAASAPAAAPVLAAALGAGTSLPVGAEVACLVLRLSGWDVGLGELEGTDLPAVLGGSPMAGLVSSRAAGVADGAAIISGARTGVRCCRNAYADLLPGAAESSSSGALRSGTMPTLSTCALPSHVSM